MVRKLTTLFLTGVFAILPLGITIAVLIFVGDKISDWLGLGSGFGKLMLLLKTQLGIPLAISYFVSFVLIVSVVTLLGYLARHYAGRRIGAMLNFLISRIPIINKVYNSVEQVVDMLRKKDGEASVALSNVVLAKLYNTYVLGMLASSEPVLINGVPHQMVFVPGSPMLATGNNYMVPCSDLLDVDISIEEITRMIMSLGSLAPGIMNTKQPLVLPAPLIPNRTTG